MGFQAYSIPNHIAWLRLEVYIILSQILMKWFWLCNFQQDQMKSAQIIQLWCFYHYAYVNISNK